MLTKKRIAQLSDEFEGKTPREILTWAIEAFWPQVALSSSFQTQSMALLHMATSIRHDLLIFFLDTGYHFWDTLIFREKIASEWRLNVLDLYRDSRWDVFVRQNVRTLPLDDPDLCCYIHKVQPMQKALKDLKAWISGIRRDQTAMRAQARILELQDDGVLKINPLLNWTRADVESYTRAHDLPSHPLFEKGFRSIGCAPCTQAVDQNEDDRAGRWAGRGKTECGLHTEMFHQKDLHGIGRDFRLNLPENFEIKD
jgi:phosphoadenosine phosphosulfate reductase